MWKIEYYRTETGRFPVAEFIDSLEMAARTRIARTLDLLEEFGIHLRMPYARHLEKQLWELRARLGKNRYRIVYFLATEGSFVLLHGFVKKTEATPAGELEIARRRLADYSGRG